MAAAPLRPAGTPGEGYASALQQSSSGHHGDASLLPSNIRHGLLQEVILGPTGYSRRVIS